MFKTLLSLILLLVVVAETARAQFSIDWFTIDGGGGASSGAGFQVAGTIGQPDAQTPPVMTGGAFQLPGGFWPVTQSCFCLGDMNGDGVKDGSDIQLFVACQLASGNCACADVDQANGVNLNDVLAFVNALIAGPSCP